MDIISSIKQTAHKTGWFLLTFFHVQLFITLVSLPILIWWGLPISIMSPIGNLIFTPFLTIFLLLSSVIFFCELLYLPHSLIIFLLELITNFWTYLCAFGNRSWLIALAKPSLLGSCAIIIISFLILHLKKPNTLYPKSLMLLYALIITICALKNKNNSEWNSVIIPCFARNIELLSARQTHILIDKGALGSRISAPAFVSYELVPKLIKHGIQTIDYVICTKPSLMTFRALILLCNKISIKKIYMPAWSGQLNNTEWSAWEELVSVCKKYNTQYILMSNALYTLEFSKGLKIKLTCVQMVKKNRFEFPEITIETQIDTTHEAHYGRNLMKNIS